MSLESKAKTIVFLSNECFYKNANFEQLWVPLVDAQKEITTLETEVKAVRQCLEFIKKLSAQRFEQIEAANNTLKQARDFIELIVDDNISANHVLNLVSTLEEELHIPRKEEPQKDVCAICQNEFVGDEERTIDSLLRVMHTQCWRDELLDCENEGNK